MGGLADFLAEAGAVVAGGAALGAAGGFVAASFLRDLGISADPVRWAEATAQLGGVFGAIALILETSGVQ
jgi:hypothetical protein